MAVTTFGIGAPINPASFTPWGNSPYGSSVNPYFVQQPYGQALMNVPFSPIAQTPFGAPLQQVLQVLQIVPTQLQQLQHSVIVQQQQLQQIQQLLQLIPGHLAQLQQLIQLVPQQTQQLSSSQLPGLTSFGATVPWGIAPQVFAQPGQVM